MGEHQNRANDFELFTEKTSSRMNKHIYVCEHNYFNYVQSKKKPWDRLRRQNAQLKIQPKNFLPFNKLFLLCAPVEQDERMVKNVWN